jgi:hypothetical protein
MRLRLLQVKCCGSGPGPGSDSGSGTLVKCVVLSRQRILLLGRKGMSRIGGTPKMHGSVTPFSRENAPFNSYQTVCLFLQLGFQKINTGLIDFITP